MVEHAIRRRPFGAVLAALAVLTGSVAAGPVAPAVAATSAWSLVSSPNNGTNVNMLTSVSCLSAKSCTAVGWYIAPGVYRTLIESWNGKTWSIASSPNVGGVWNYLNGVSCAATNACMAVGTYNSSNGTNQTLVESWNGKTWSVVPSPNRGTDRNSLLAVSCVSPRSCVAVGTWTASAVNRTLIESWNGKTWSVVKTSPNPGTKFNALAGVSCVSTTSCRAVGQYYAGTVSRTLTESWNGKTWSVTPSPNRSATFSRLSGVSCISASSCKAVGDSAVSDPHQPVIESWNGKSWSVEKSLQVVGARSSVLTSVSCGAAKSCKAVGWYETNDDVFQTLIASWTGTAWAVVPSPNPPAGTTADIGGLIGSVLYGVSCVTNTSCRTVGYTVDAGGVDRTLIASRS